MEKKKGTLHKAEFNQWTVYDLEDEKVYPLTSSDIFALNAGYTYLTEGSEVLFTLNSHNAADLGLKREQTISVRPNSAVLVFDMFEDAQDLELALEGSKWHHIVWDIDQELRKVVKYGENYSGEARDFADNFREEIRRIMDSWGVGFKD
jgi:hypothetical protein